CHPEPSEESSSSAGPGFYSTHSAPRLILPPCHSERSEESHRSAGPGFYSTLLPPCHSERSEESLSPGTSLPGFFAALRMTRGRVLGVGSSGLPRRFLGARLSGLAACLQPVALGRVPRMRPLLAMTGGIAASKRGVDF